MLQKQFGVAVLLISVSVLLHGCTSSGKANYKRAQPYANANAWYVGSWQGENDFFEPSLKVEMTIAPDGKVFSFAHGGNRAYKVTSKGKLVNIDRLPDTPMRGKMQSADALVLEDGGTLHIRQEGDGLRTTISDMDITVLYHRVNDSSELEAIQQRAAALQAEDPHHKDHDFWHSKEFWTVVVTAAASATVDALHHHDHLEIKGAAGLSKSDEKALRRYYK